MFQNFLVINFFLSIISELIVFCFLSYINYDSSQIFFPCGPSALLISLYINFIREFPIVPFVSIFGISLSIHNLPFFAFLQVSWLHFDFILFYMQFFFRNFGVFKNYYIKILTILAILVLVIARFSGKKLIYFHPHFSKIFHSSR